MATWKCSSCGNTREGRCRPAKCDNCDAPKDNFVKEEK